MDHPPTDGPAARGPAMRDARLHGAPLLDVRGLRITFSTSSGPVTAVRGVDLRVAPGETLAIVGESGSGKSTSVLGMLGLFRDDVATIDADHITFDSRPMTARGRDRLGTLLGRRIGVIFQDPQSSLNPTARIGTQVGEVLRAHHGMSRRAADARVLQALDEVGIPDPAWCARAYPHQLSGGMRQRVMIAMATIAEPALLIADEPTTALDVTLQAQIVDLLLERQRDHGTAIIFITHDLSLVSGFADRVMVMYAGQAVETDDAERVVAAPTHPYTRALIDSVPSLDGPAVTPIVGRPPDPRNLPSGCAFAPRCTFADHLCHDVAPPMTTTARCWHPIEIGTDHESHDHDDVTVDAVPATTPHENTELRHGA